MKGPVHIQRQMKMATLILSIQYETKYKLDLPIERGDGDRGRHHQVLGVGVVRVHSGSSLGQSSEMLLCNIYLKAV